MHGLHQVRARDPSDPIIPKGSVSPKEGAIRAWAYALALIVLGFPVFSPDLFWHLSAGRWMLAHFQVPRVDPFSFTMAGSPWIDFEWLSQLILYGVGAAGGELGLWVMKGALLLAAFIPVDGLLRDREASPLARAGALALWTAAMVPQADLRVDLCSAAFFAWLLRRLESGRASFLFGFALFALWSNLHAGFVMGLFLYGLYAWGERPAGLPAEAAGAVLGSFLNPYGAGIYRVLAAHATEPAMARFVMEWGPPNWHRAFQVPLLAALVVTGAFILVQRKRLARRPAAAALALGLATLASARLAAYFAPAAVACVFVAGPRPRARWLVVGMATLSLMLVPPLMRVRWGASFQDDYVARRAVEFIARERATLAPLRLFNQYEWGGYLGWRLGEGYKVFGDGRYLFHSQLPEMQKALGEPGGIAELSRRRGLDGFLVKNERVLVSSTREYPDGSRREIPRPWHVFAFPRERWALVYWDDQALLFLDRAKVSSSWLAEHEYRWLRPGDDAALSDALSRREVRLPALASERARHAREMRSSKFTGF